MPALAFLRSLPERQALLDEETSVSITHQLPGARTYITAETEAAALLPFLAGEKASILLFGHSHQPYDRFVGRKRLVNPGSVGQLRDGLPHPSFVLWTRAGFDFRRVPYDVTRTLQALERLPMTEAYKSRWRDNFTRGVVPPGS